MKEEVYVPIYAAVAVFLVIATMAILGVYVLVQEVGTSTEAKNRELCRNANARLLNVSDYTCTPDREFQRGDDISRGA